jgi:hypothetical protein
LGRRVGRYSRVAGPEHFVGGLRKARVPEESARRAAGIPEIDHAKYHQSKAESRKKLARSPIVFAIVQETRDPHFQ